MAQLLRACVAFCLVGFLVASSSTWSYSDPSEWEDDCDGRSQSPIDIDTDDVQYSSNLGSFSLSNWGSSSEDDSGQQATFTMINNGHSLQVNVDSPSVHISGASLNGDYKTAQLHFHWGSDSSHGSEHLIDGDSFPMELHVVHYKESYGSIANALSHSDGLAVMAFLFRVSSSRNSNYDRLLSYFSGIPNGGDQVSIPAFNLKNLIPSNLDGYFRYSGSLTTPPCSEVVTWSMFHNKISLSESQIEQFRNLYEDNGGHHLEDNFRPTQSKNGRIVKTSRRL